MRKTAAILFALLLMGGRLAWAQGFINLNFEQASIQPAPSGYTPSDAINPISAASTLPGWTVSEDDTICTAVWGSPVALDETSVALVSAGYSPIQGSYSVQLSAYANAPSGFFQNSSISQTGLIPVGTQSIQFLIASPSQAGIVPPNPIVTLNGTPISLSEISQSGGVITMAGNIGAYAGTRADLIFICEGAANSSFPANEDYFNLDDIQFSPSAAPEPGVTGLLGMGGLIFGLCRWKNIA